MLPARDREIIGDGSIILPHNKVKIGDKEYASVDDNIVVRIDPKYYRPTEVDLLIGDPTKAMTKLGWKPKYNLAALVKEMVASDLEIFKKELLLKENGYSVTKESE
jgi:GDPmannose 4,6-dehydratase